MTQGKSRDQRTYLRIGRVITISTHEVGASDQRSRPQNRQVAAASIYRARKVCSELLSTDEKPTRVGKEREETLRKLLLFEVSFGVSGPNKENGGGDEREEQHCDGWCHEMFVKEAVQ